jgi:hypothetical protein
MKKRARAFALDLDRWIAESRDKARQQFVAISLEAHARLVDLTPIDTGFCRSQWGFAIGDQPPRIVVDRPQDAEGLAAAVSATAGLAGALKAEVGDLVWVFNPTRYATALENGHSGQAPNGMVKIAMAELKAAYGRRRSAR